MPFFRSYASWYSPGENVNVYLFTITDQLDVYSHTIAANGNFESASITIKDNVTNLETWMAEGLGREIRVHNEAMEVIWEGFIDSLVINTGIYSVTRGPLMGVVNRVYPIYTPIIDPDAIPPILGTKTEYVASQDLESIGKYGLHEKVLNLGNLLDEDVPYLRDLYLSENKEALSAAEISIGGDTGDEISIQLQCKGYTEWLKNYIDFWGLQTHTTDAQNRIIISLSTMPSLDLTSFTSYQYIEYNGILVPYGQYEYRTIYDVIMEIVGMGDIDGNRWVFGFQADREPFYKAASTAIDYLYQVKTSIPRVTDTHGTEIKPWNIRPNKWIQVTDFMIAQVPENTALRSDPRNMFIESVTYTAPYSVMLQGSRDSKMTQIMASLGLSGIV